MPDLMVAIGNPIRGPLHDNSWVRPPGNTDMRVTQTAAQHVARGGPPALDIGDGNPDLDEVLAPHAGTVSQALTGGSANLAIDFDSGGEKHRIVLAHNTLPHPVRVGQAVTEGQVVGRMGRTGAAAIHLHIQLGYLVGALWVWVDPWPYLRQNGATDEEIAVTILTIEPIPVTVWQAKAGALTGYQLGAPAKSGTFDAGSGAHCDGVLTAIDPAPAGWPAPPLLRVTDGHFAGHFVAQRAVTFTRPDPWAQIAAARAALA